MFYDRIAHQNESLCFGLYSDLPAIKMDLPNSSAYWKSKDIERMVNIFLVALSGLKKGVHIQHKSKISQFDSEKLHYY